MLSDQAWKLTDLRNIKSSVDLILLSNIRILLGLRKECLHYAHRSEQFIRKWLYCRRGQDKYWPSPSCVQLWQKRSVILHARLRTVDRNLKLANATMVLVVRYHCCQPCLAPTIRTVTPRRKLRRLRARFAFLSLVTALRIQYQVQTRHLCFTFFASDRSFLNLSSLHEYSCTCRLWARLFLSEIQAK